jgi:hypothetical protein
MSASAAPLAATPDGIARAIPAGWQVKHGAADLWRVAVRVCRS